MRLKHFCLWLGLGLLTIAPAAQAADWNNGAGGLKGGGRQVVIPVPAPIPIAETFRWYLRADIGGGVLSGGDASERGLQYGLLDGDPLTTPIGTSSSWFDNGFDTFVMGGVGAGLYLSPRWRVDATVDVRTKSDIEGNGAFSYDGNPTVYDPVIFPAGVTIRGTTIDRTEVRSTVSLLNLYYDMTDRGTRFTPYIGVGAGFVVRSMQRNHSTTELVMNDDPLATTNPIGVRTFEAKSKAHQVAPAIAATAGISYTLHTGMVLDVNYRFAYLGSVDFNSRIDASNSRLTIDETLEHAVRAGIRWNVW